MPLSSSLRASNTRHVKVFGELEFWLSIIKVAAIIAMIGGGIILLFMGASLSDGGHSGVDNLWVHGGFAPNGIGGLLASLTVVVFAFDATSRPSASPRAKPPTPATPSHAPSTLSPPVFFSSMWGRWP